MDIQFDIIEVVLKQNIGIKLTEQEENYLKTIDDEVENTIMVLINDSSYLDEVIKLLDHIIQKSSNLPIDEQNVIKEKCIAKKIELEKLTNDENKSLSM